VCKKKKRKKENSKGGAEKIEGSGTLKKEGTHIQGLGNEIGPPLFRALDRGLTPEAGPFYLF
jgi:hypothetical protein